MKKQKNSRRKFIKNTAAAATAFTIVDRHILGGVGHAAPSDKLNIAAIGSGGMGRNNIRGVSSENIVALCDVDDKTAAKTYQQYPDVPKYRDFRKMLEKHKDIDAVIVATPDHFHTVAAVTAMRLGKHVYVQKPLTRLVSEARLLTETARKYKVQTQMGNQGHSGEGVRSICEWIWDGAIGDVHEVHSWTNRPVWPQDVLAPTDTMPIPDTLSWDLWLGPAEARPYNSAYQPFNWRAFWDFGAGALGDMACHVIDPVFSALKLKYPTGVEASTSTFCPSYPPGNKRVNNDTYPQASIVHYDFPARGDMPPVKFHWYDGGLLPKMPEGVDSVKGMGNGRSGSLFVGSKGMLMCNEYGDKPRLLPESLDKSYQRPPQSIPRIEVSHEMNWVNACKGGEPACSNFDYSGPLTETVVMGNLAMRHPQQKLKWDGENMRITNLDEANEFVNMHYRSGWEL